MKTTCPITRTQFTTKAASLQVQLAGQPLLITPRQFSTGSVGWYGNQKATITVDGVPCQCQVAVTVTVVGSKELPGATGSDESIQAAISTPEVQAIVAANKAKAAESLAS